MLSKTYIIPFIYKFETLYEIVKYMVEYYNFDFKTKPLVVIENQFVDLKRKQKEFIIYKD